MEQWRVAWWESEWAAKWAPKREFVWSGGLWALGRELGSLVVLLEKS
jgi:hypothetical protein